MEDGNGDRIADVVTALRFADAAYANALIALAEARPEHGVPAERLIGLAANVPGWDVSFLTSCVEVLRSMPRLREAFQGGAVSWSQLRSIISRARRLPVAGQARLDALLAGPLAANATSEPEALVDHATAIITRLEDLAVAERELAAERRSFVRFQPDLFGGADLWGHLDDVAAATLVTAIDAAADAPVADAPVLDDDGNAVPVSWQAPTARSEQRAEGLRRRASAYLAGSRTGQAKPTVQVIVDVRTLTGAAGGCAGTAGRSRATTSPVIEAHDVVPSDTDADVLIDVGRPDRVVADRDGGVPLATSRLIWNLAGGRRPTSTSRVLQLSCDATWVRLLTDGNAVLATGDAHDPISAALRRAILARDQGCRFPGCAVPAAHCDLHHLIHRADGGATTPGNLAALCRAHHSMVHRHRWRLSLDDDATLTVRRGRYRLISRARLRPPPADGYDNGAAGQPDRSGSAAGRYEHPLFGDRRRANSSADHDDPPSSRPSDGQRVLVGVGADTQAASAPVPHPAGADPPF